MVLACKTSYSFFVGRWQNIMVLGDRIKYLRAGTVMIHALQLFLTCCAALLLKQSPAAKISLKVTSFRKWSPRCLNLNAAHASQSQRAHVRPFILLVCIYHTQDCLPVQTHVHLSESTMLAAPSLFVAGFSSN
jgi:hypothetical protein